MYKIKYKLVLPYEAILKIAVSVYKRLKTYSWGYFGLENVSRFLIKMERWCPGGQQELFYSSFFFTILVVVGPGGIGVVL